MTTVLGDFVTIIPCTPHNVTLCTSKFLCAPPLSPSPWDCFKLHLFYSQIVAMEPVPKGNTYSFTPISNQYVVQEEPGMSKNYSPRMDTASGKSWNKFRELRSKNQQARHYCEYAMSVLSNSPS